MPVYGLLAYLVIRHTQRTWHVPVAMLSATLSVFVGFSRVLTDARKRCRVPVSSPSLTTTALRL